MRDDTQSDFTSGLGEIEYPLSSIYRSDYVSDEDEAIIFDVASHKE